MASDAALGTLLIAYRKFVYQVGVGAPMASERHTSLPTVGGIGGCDLPVPLCESVGPFPLFDVSSAPGLVFRDGCLDHVDPLRQCGRVRFWLAAGDDADLLNDVMEAGSSDGNEAIPSLRLCQDRVHDVEAVAGPYLVGNDPAVESSEAFLTRISSDPFSRLCRCSQPCCHL